tara:strand:- start:137 stop:475 length:339 start_codon:yes stop_codon:yes gene_type:complete
MPVEKQAELLPNSTATKYHNAKFNKWSRNRSWLIDISCYPNKKDTFYFLNNIHEKINPVTYTANYEFTSKKEALKFIEAVNGKLTTEDKNFKRWSMKQAPDGTWRKTHSKYN